MLSSDRNVETLAQLIELLKSYAGVQSEYLKLDVIEKVVRLLTALTVALVFLLLGVAVLFYLSFAVIYWMAAVVGTAWAFFLVAVFFLVLLLLVVCFRKAWIERPLVRFLAEILLSK